MRTLKHLFVWSERLFLSKINVRSCGNKQLCPNQNVPTCQTHLEKKKKEKRKKVKRKKDQKEKKETHQKDN